VHISATPCANEALCLPCRTHGEEDKDYALAFAVPLHAPGIRLLAVEPCRELTGRGEFDYPKTSELQPTECLIVFDERVCALGTVFMCGEWQFSRHLAYAFASYQPPFGTCKMIGKLEIITGAAGPDREYNGVDKVPHVRKKLAWMAMITETWHSWERRLSGPRDGFATTCPCPTGWPSMLPSTPCQQLPSDVPHLQDIAEDCPPPSDFPGLNNPEIRPYIEKYLTLRTGFPRRTGFG